MRTVGGMSMISPRSYAASAARGVNQPQLSVSVPSATASWPSRHAPDEEAGVEATRVLPRRDPAREVVEGVGRGPQIMRLEERAELLARVQPPAQRRELGRERSIEDARRRRSASRMPTSSNSSRTAATQYGSASGGQSPSSAGAQDCSGGSAAPVDGVIAGIDDAARKCVHAGEGDAAVTLEHQDRERGVTGALVAQQHQGARRERLDVRHGGRSVAGVMAS